MIFVDTGAWFASVVPSIVIMPQRPIGCVKYPTTVTTDYIVDETLTLLKVRGQTLRAMRLGEQFFRGTLATIYYLTEADIMRSWQIFHQFSDKEWSFTDCTSKVVLDKLHLRQAFAFDHHFHQFGSIEVVP